MILLEEIIANESTIEIALETILRNKTIDEN